jgi:phosphoserine phosphatase RsbU/P
LSVSDGVTDCPSSDVGMFGEEGLEELMQDRWNIRGAAFFDALIWSLTASVESDDFPDDLSGILFESSD